MKAIAALVLAALLGPGDDETVALTNVRIIPVGKAEIPSGTIVIKNGKFTAVGADVKPPAGARVVDAKGLTAFPGLVHPYSRLGLADGPAPSGVTAQNLAYDELNPAHEAYAQSLRSGVTAFLLQPGGSGVAGQGAVVKPVGLSRDDLVLEKSACLRMSMQSGTAGKDPLRQALDAAKKAIEGEKKSPPAKPDDKILPMVRFLKGELTGIVEVPGPAELLHFWQLMEPYAEFKPRIVFVGSPDLYKAAAELGGRKARVILRPFVALAPFTRERINTAAELQRAGVEVALAPASDSPDALAGFLFRVGELVKFGLPREAALRAVTLLPAEMAGIEKRTGSIETGKDADLLLFSGDPLSPLSTLKQVYINGSIVYQGE